jgi:uncharacterized protein with von Willebrand factor type A (vWA) domain
VQSQVHGLVAELRAVGIPVRTSEVIDACRALGEVDLGRRSELRAALAACVVKSDDQMPIFDVTFDTYFPATQGRSGGWFPDIPQAETAVADSGSGGGLADLSDAALRSLVIRALAENYGDLLRRLAPELVSRHAGMVAGRAVAGTYYLVRTLRALDPDGLVAAVVDAAPAPASPLVAYVVVDQAKERVAQLRGVIETEIRNRLVADRGADPVARTTRQPLPEDVAFLTASSEQIDRLRHVVEPMARRLAARLAASQRDSSRGRLDVRATMRAAMATAGTPVRPMFRRPRPAKPELVVLADISGSVATFATFTLSLTYALRSAFAKVRSFVFIDGVDEVTDLMTRASDLVEVARAINKRGLGVRLDGRSDYGSSLADFAADHAGSLGRRTAVLVLGDARTNYHAPRAEQLRALSRKVGRLYWLNPEPRAAWNSGDSVIDEYAPACDQVVECRSIRQLRTFVETLDFRAAPIG